MNAPDTDEHVHGAPYDHLGMRNNVEQYRTHLQHMFMQGTPHVHWVWRTGNRLLIDQSVGFKGTRRCWPVFEDEFCPVASPI